MSSTLTVKALQPGHHDCATMLLLLPLPMSELKSPFHRLPAIIPNGLRIGL